MNQPKNRTLKTKPEDANGKITRNDLDDAVAEFNRLVGQCLAQKWLTEQEALRREKS
jgi:hypothetical protein